MSNIPLGDKENQPLVLGEADGDMAGDGAMEALGDVVTFPPVAGDAETVAFGEAETVAFGEAETDPVPETVQAANIVTSTRTEIKTIIFFFIGYSS